MDKKIIISTVLISFIFLILGYIVLSSSTKKQQQKSSSLLPKKEEIVFYYGNTCPHCADVEKWMKQNKVDEKLKIVKKEVYQNQANAQELGYVAQSCGFSSQNIGVPFLYTDGQCYIGTPYVIKKLKEKMDSKKN